MSSLNSSVVLCEEVFDEEYQASNDGKISIKLKFDYLCRKKNGGVDMICCLFFYVCIIRRPFLYEL